MSAVAAKRVILKNKVGEYIVPEVAKAAEVLEGNMDPVTSDAVFRKLEKFGSGKSLGEIFAYSGTNPPPGAYLLNGQTIRGCRELYPDFWQWLTGNAESLAPVYVDWEMPTLVDNGWVGGSSYGVSATADQAEGAYRMFDGDKSTGFSTYLMEAPRPHVTFYSPNPIRISRISAYYTVPGFTFGLAASVDGSKWVSLGNLQPDTSEQNIEVADDSYDSETPGYRYLRVSVKAGNPTFEIVKFPDIVLYGTEYLGIGIAGGILSLTAEEYELYLAAAGVCGGFVIDSDTGDVRLPSITNGTLWGSSAHKVGTSLAAGLPDLYGEFGASTQTTAESSTGVFETGASLSGVRGSSAGSTVSFKASRGNPIYGNSDTVQPPAVCVVWCIQVYSAATTMSTQESALLAGQLQLKAQTDLGNVAENLDFVIESWKAVDGPSWYRKYRSGWVEQGGVIGEDKTSGYNSYTVILFKPFADTRFNVQVTGRFDSSTDKGTNTCYARTESSISIVTAGYGCDWYACGQGATE